ncbi:transposase [Rhodovulum sulfidophilum]|nr:transposase [Rhodovulum sulfidophilum]
MPDYSTLCRRQARIAVQIPYRRSGTPLNLRIDSPGDKFRGDGEWPVHKYGPFAAGNGARSI